MVGFKGKLEFISHIRSEAHNKCVQPTAHALSICVHARKLAFSHTMTSTCTAADAGVRQELDTEKIYEISRSVK